MKRILSVLAVVSAFVTGSYASDIDNEISVEISGGLSTMYYSHTGGNYDPMAGTSGAVNYVRHFNNNWGFGVGAGVRLYQSRIRFDSYEDQYTTTAISVSGISEQTNNLQFSYKYTDFEDRQQALYLTIPIFAQYQHEIGFYTRFGVQVGVPLSGGSRIHYSELKTKGYFPFENAEYDNLPQHGFGTYKDGETDVTMSYRMNTSLMAEVGWNWDWNNQYVLYLGVTGEYGFNNMFKRSVSQPQLVYNNGDFIYTPIWETNIRRDGSNERANVTGDKIRSYALGIVLRYSFGW